MACTRTLKIALVALVFLAGLLAIDLAAEARDIGFKTIAGNAGYSKVKPRTIRSMRHRIRNKRFSRHHGYRGRGDYRGRSGYHNRRKYHNRHNYQAAGAALLDLGWYGSIGNRYDDNYIRRNSLMRDLVSDSPRRPAPKIIRVSRKMLILGEERAARREARMLAEMENLDIRYYRDNEAYDARFPSIVYLDLLDK